jgi:polygalacturonase
MAFENSRLSAPVFFISMRTLLLFIIGASLTTNAFSQNTYNIADFGAVGDHLTLNTQAIQKAIDKAHEKNGGKVIVPVGSFVTGTIDLKSGVELHLMKGAVLVGSLNPGHYPKGKYRNGLIVSSGQQNISITGKGTIDGQGLKLALIADSLHHAGIRIDPNYNYRRMRPSELTRPMIIDFHGCKKIKISGITLKDSPSWVQNYTLCEDLEIDSINVNSVAFWNNDGIDISGCRNVRITHCIVNAADDGICLKSENKEQINDHIYIGDCVIRSSASAIKFGTASHGGFKNIVIENSKVYDTYRSAIALESVDGGDIENVEIRNIEVLNTGNAIFIRLGHRNKDDHVGTLKNVTIRNVKAQIPFERADKAYDLRGPDLPFFHNPFPASITGLPGHPVENVTIENVEITYPGRASKAMGYIPITRLKQVPEREDEYPEFSMFGELPSWAFYVRHVNGITMRNVKVNLENVDYRPAFVFDDVQKIQLEKVTLPSNKKTSAIILNNSGQPMADSVITQSIITIKP